MVLYINESLGFQGVTRNDIEKALDDRVGVIITYEGDTSTRYIEPYVYGATLKNNDCIRAYQYYGSSKTGTPSWKMFLVDKIESWEPTNQKFNVDPKARGWATNAFNQNGDKSMSVVYKIVDLNEEPLTDYEKLKAKTERLKNSTPVNINQLNKPKDETKPTTTSQSGPIGEPNTQQTAEPMESPVENDSKDNTSNPVFGNGQQTSPSKNNEPVKPESEKSGPITGDVTNPEENKAEDLMSNDDFRKMLQRNLEISDQEKEKRQKKNLPNQ